MMQNDNFDIRYFLFDILRFKVWSFRFHKG